MPNKDQNICCCIFSIIAGLVLSVAIAAAFFAGIVATISVLFYVTLIVGILGFIFLIFSLLCSKKESCKCFDSSCLVASFVGSIITSIFALTATTIASGSFSTAILVGAVAFFLFFSLLNLIKTFICLSCNNRECR